MFEDPKFWLLISFIIFVILMYKPFNSMLIGGLDSKIEEIKKNILTVRSKLSPRCGKVLNMSETTKEIPIWVGGESGQRKRYLRSLEKELAAELGPDWRNVIELAKDS